MARKQLILDVFDEGIFAAEISNTVNKKFFYAPVNLFKSGAITDYETAFYLIKKCTDYLKPGIFDKVALLFDSERLFFSKDEEFIFTKINEPVENFSYSLHNDTLQFQIEKSFLHPYRKIFKDIGISNYKIIPRFAALNLKDKAVFKVGIGESFIYCYDEGLKFRETRYVDYNLPLLTATQNGYESLKKEFFSGEEELNIIRGSIFERRDDILALGKKKGMNENYLELPFILTSKTKMYYEDLNLTGL